MNWLAGRHRNARVVDVKVRDAVGTEMNDVTYVNVNAPLTVAATMTPEVFVGDGELRTIVSANVSGGAGGYQFNWVSDPAIAGLFDEVDTTGQEITFRARDVKDLQVSFNVTVTDADGNTATATARRGGGEDPNPPAPIPNELLVSIADPPTCMIVNATTTLDGVATGGVEPLSYSWTAACGNFADSKVQDPSWTAPASAQTCAMTFTATDKNGLAKSQTIAVKVAVPTVQFVSAASTTSLEAVAAESTGHVITVVLKMPDGCALAEPVTVDAVDAASGTATADADYEALAVPTTVTFPAGSVNGDTQTVSLKVLDDRLVEGPETVVLQLTNVTGGAALGSAAEHTVTIADDDEAVLSIVDANAERRQRRQHDPDGVHGHPVQPQRQAGGGQFLDRRRHGHGGRQRLRRRRWHAGLPTGRGHADGQDRYHRRQLLREQRDLPAGPVQSVQRPAGQSDRPGRRRHPQEQRGGDDR